MSEDVFDSDEAIAEFKALMRDPAARQAFVQLRADQAEGGARSRYEHILRAVGETPWAIRPAMLGVIIDILAFRAAGGRLTPDELVERIGAGRPARPNAPKGVAVLPLHGVIVPKAGMMSELSGATSIEAFRSNFRQAMAADDVSALAFDIDSPGGMVDQVPEMAAEIRAHRGIKPMVAIANGEAASAAYWLGSQADSFVVTKSGRVGSIGVFSAHEDESAKAEKAGVRTTLVSAGRYKTDGNPFEPLTESAREHMQAMVDEYYGMFVADVAKGRGVPIDVVTSGFGEGRVVGAATALREGMVDSVGSLESAVAPLLRLGARSAELPPVALSFGQFALDAGGIDPTVDDYPTHGIVALDDSPWDGGRAMGQCSTAAEYRSICAGERSVGDPDQRQHWALPHHYLGREANAAGVAAARARFDQTQGLTNTAEARRHLFETHKLPSDSAQGEDGSPELWAGDEELIDLETTIASLRNG